MKFELKKWKWSTMTLWYKVCLFAVKFFEDHDIKFDRAELLSLSIHVKKKPIKILLMVTWLSKLLT